MLVPKASTSSHTFSHMIATGANYNLLMTSGPSHPLQAWQSARLLFYLITTWRAIYGEKYASSPPYKALNIAVVKSSDFAGHP